MKKFAPFALALGLMIAGAPAVTLHAQDGHYDSRWEPAPPSGQYSRAWNSGFRDGVDAARHDISAGRRPDPDHHSKFRHPDLPRRERPDFREGFRRAYYMVYDHERHSRDRYDHHDHHRDHDDNPDL